MTLQRSITYLWAFPVSFIGLVPGALAKLFGAKIAVISGVLEISLAPRNSSLQALARRSAFSAITFGHVVLAASEQDQNHFRSHERVHVKQYERWGPLFLLAYPAESAMQLLRGRRPYLDNRFEVQARERAARRTNTSTEARDDA